MFNVTDDKICKDMNLGSGPDITSLEECKNGCANSKTCVAAVWSARGPTTGCWLKDETCVIEDKVDVAVYVKRKAE